MAITFTPTDPSTPIEKLYLDLMFGSQTIEKGLVQVIPGQRNKTLISRFYGAVNKITAAVATPTVAADALTKDEKTIQSAEIMFYDEFNPKNFNLDESFLWSIGPSVTASAATIITSGN